MRARSSTRRAAVALVAVIAGAILSGSAAASGELNAKHFFWAPGQSPDGTVDSVSNDIIYHGGNAGAGAIGVETKPAVYLIYWGTGVGHRLHDAPTPTASSTRARRSRTT